MNCQVQAILLTAVGALRRRQPGHEKKNSAGGAGGGVVFCAASPGFPETPSDLDLRSSKEACSCIPPSSPPRRACRPLPRWPDGRTLTETAGQSRRAVGPASLLMLQGITLLPFYWLQGSTLLPL